MEVWNFVADPNNQKTIAWLAGGASVAVSGLWAGYLTIKKSKKQSGNSPPAAGVSQGILAGRDVSIHGEVNLTRSKSSIGIVALGALGLLAIFWASFLSPRSNCVISSVTSGGDIVAETITISGGEGDVDC